MTLQRIAHLGTICVNLLLNPCISVVLSSYYCESPGAKYLSILYWFVQHEVPRGHLPENKIVYN
jgi:hypothetical protein